MQPQESRSFTAISKQGILRVLVSKVSIGTPFEVSCPPQSPDTKEYNAIWDTGATGTVITKKVVADCGLRPISMTKVHTAAGINTVPVYLTSLYLPNKVCFPQLRVTEGVIADDAEVLIGMDVISKGDFAVTNTDGKTMFTFRIPSIESIDFAKKQPFRAPFKIGRNSPCPCGSGKKYKNCCGK